MFCNAGPCWLWGWCGVVGLHSFPIYGGATYGPQEYALHIGVDIIVCKLECIMVTKHVLCSFIPFMCYYV